ncbi:MAG: hypothetical protein IAG13_07135, partial [Deltaproteobacteria bacterium]|nr:hypothetical protein [Nannocystaceae bacterium]
MIGAYVDPWVDAARLARVFDLPQQGFAARHRAYVSGDPHARIDGTALPVPAKSTVVSHVTLDMIITAVAAASRAPRSAVRERGRVRGLFVALALDQGWSERWRLAEACGCSRRAIDKHALEVDRAALAAAQLCLGDAR